MKPISDSMRAYLTNLQHGRVDLLGLKQQTLAALVGNARRAGYTTMIAGETTITEAGQAVISPSKNNAGDTCSPATTGDSMVPTGQDPERDSTPMTTKNNDKMSNIDQAINAARSRKANRASAASTAPSDKAPKAAKQKLSPEEKAARTAAKDADKAMARSQRDRARAEKQAAKDASKGRPHLAKVMKAAAKLPALGPAAQQLFNEVTVNLTSSDVASLAAHLTHFNRANATQRAIGTKLEVGQHVRIVGGDPRYIGQTGTVERSQRIRCYVTVEGVKKPVYLFVSDVEVMAQPRSATA